MRGAGCWISRWVRAKGGVDVVRHRLVSNEIVALLVTTTMTVNTVRETPEVSEKLERGRAFFLCR